MPHGTYYPEIVGKSVWRNFAIQNYGALESRTPSLLAVSRFDFTNQRRSRNTGVRRPLGGPGGSISGPARCAMRSGRR
jgi:hypothetical protein